MSAMLSKSLPLSSNFTMDEEAKASEKQGIVSILGSDFEKTNATTPSLRRTLSADMSSKKWLAQNGFSSVKKIPSSHELLASISDSSSTSSDDDEEHQEYLERKDLNEKERLDIWNSIREAKMKKDQEPEKTNEPTSWISILSQKVEDSKLLPPPYVHPLVKRSASTLSEKSLEICTESLGSETGSDGFSSYPPSEAEDAEDEKAEENLPERAKQMLGKDEYGLPPVKSKHYLGSKKAVQSRSFPPPLPSLSRGNGASLSMRSSRNNGRLVLEAISVSSQNYFQAERREGRLILTFVNRSSTLDQEVENVETLEEEKKPVMELDEESVVFNEKCDDEENANEEEVEELEEAEEGKETPKLDISYGAKETAFSIEKAPNMSGAVTNLHKLALLMNKPIGLPNRNPKWASKFNEVVSKYTEAAKGEEEPISLEQSHPLQPQVARMIPTPPTKANSSFNAYEYFWRTKPTTTSYVNTITKQPSLSLKNYSNNCTRPMNSSGLNEIYHAGAPVVKSCNEPRRSLFFWEPNCIATS
ncbi:protein FAF-like, chloroplastic [Punica granatum]|uniref:Protein FAF-like, chloroplastic n=2 Tax=Punica granatum TaxID=22663 RepID=A0A6P8BUI8_PUNGR|nr:protein FAF-like, chloroplastic [Punica granatum]XP_031373113.1 protein FAF-like, chloroplastic [Punica granatum]OWM63100.1 hypothetical protein CDL15_Pgr008016 [Punica granatum]PKI63946.1 hypothetical protein CRG98_015622 [Punica granatum]